MSAFFPHILQRHLNELDELLDLRAGAFRLGTRKAASVAELDDRILAHADGLAVAGTAALPILADALQQDEPGLRKAAAFALPSCVDGVELIVSALHSSEQRTHVLDALAWNPPGARQLVPAVSALLAKAPAAIAGAAALVLARQGESVTPEVLVALLKDPDADVLAAQVTAYNPLDLAGDLSRQLEYAAGTGNPELQFAALSSGLWTRQRWALPLLRSVCSIQKGALTPLHGLLAAVAEPADLAALSALPITGRDRLMLLATLGHADGLASLLEAMGDSALGSAHQAAEAFEHVTSQRFRTQQRKQLHAEEDAEEVFVPDVAKAQAFWRNERGRFEKSARWVEGQPAHKISPMSRTLCLRCRQQLSFAACQRPGWKGRLGDIDALPLPVDEGGPRQVTTRSLAIAEKRRSSKVW